MDAIYLGYLDWLETQIGKKAKESISWIKNIAELNERRAPGNTCISALASGKMGTIKEPINDSKGCGSVMRIAPIGIDAKDPNMAGEVAADVSAITHGHPLGIIPSYVMACMINFMLNKNMDIVEALNESISQLKRYRCYKRIR